MDATASGFNDALIKDETLHRRRGLTTSQYFTMAALYISFFSTLPTFELACQVTSVMFLGLAAISTSGEIYAARPSVFEGCLLLMAAFSFLSFFVSFDAYSAVYTCMFAFAVLSISVIARSMSSKDLLKVTSGAFALMVVTTAIFEHQGWFTSLIVSADMRWAFRFTPFDIHPNLTGLIFCGAATLLVGYGATLRSRAKWAFFLLAAACVSVTLAASARGPLLALISSSGLCVPILLRRLSARQAFALSVISLIALVLAVLYAESILSYLWVALELGSEQRGLESGGTGRVELWRQGYELIMSRTWQTFIGSGLRTSDPDHIGFWTENSYITIVLESGIFAATAMCGALLGNIWKAASIARLAARRDAVVYVGLLIFIVFFTVESLSNRYLIAIGNPISLSFLLISVRMSILPLPGPPDSQPLLDFRSGSRDH